LLVEADLVLRLLFDDVLRLVRHRRDVERRPRLERPEERIGDHAEEPAEQRHAGGRSTILVRTTRQPEAEQPTDEERRVRNHHDEQPRAHDEATDGEEALPDRRRHARKAFASLPRLLEARREAMDEIAVLGDAEMTAIFAREPVEAGLDVAA